MNAPESKLSLCDHCRICLNTRMSRLVLSAMESGAYGGYTLRRSTRLAAQRMIALLPRGKTYDVLSTDRHDTMPDLPNLRTSAEAGCDFCRFVRDAITSSRGAPLDNEVDPVSLELRLHYKSGPFHEIKSKATTIILVLSVSSRAPRRPENKAVKIIAFRMLWPIGAHPGQAASILRMPKPLSDRALIDKEIRFVQKRLQHCVAICDHNNERDEFLPRRLLYVYHEKLRIVEFNDEHVAKRDTRYVTLSYCWGAPDEAASQVKLTDQSVVHLKSGFSVEELSPIQKDAVHATRILGVHFIWIDALCIRQDSRSDWERESSVMDRIYANSYLTICTLTSASCQEGFLQRPEYPRRIKIPYDMTRDDSECFEIGHAAVYDSDSDWTESDIDNNRWSTRGWTFQEKLLATRILYFGNTGLHFACSTQLCSEFSDFDEKPRSLVLDAILKIQDSKSGYQSWYSHVAQRFSARQLTYIGDTLPALSGLARRFAEATNDRYLAGLWEKDLVHGLLWTLRRPELNSLLDLVESLKDKQNYVGPSWTRAGRGALSSFLRGKRDLLSRSHSLQVNHLQCKVMRASTTPNGQDSFGTVSGGILILKAYICPLRLAGFSWKTQESPWHPHMGDFWINKPNEKGVFFFCNLDWNPLEEVQWPGELTMALIGSIEDSGSHRGSNISRPSGLLLYKTGTPEQYVRVGLFGPSIRKARK